MEIQQMIESIHSLMKVRNCPQSWLEMGMFISEALDQIETLDAESSWHFIETIKMQGKQNDVTHEFFESMWQDKQTFSLMGGKSEHYPLFLRGHSVHSEIAEFEEFCLSLVRGGSWQVVRNLLLVFGNGFHENGWDWETWQLDTIMQFIAAECIMESSLDNFNFWLDSKVKFVGTEQLNQREELKLFEISFVSRTAMFIDAIKVINSFKLGKVECQSEIATLISKTPKIDLDLEFVFAFSLSFLSRNEDEFIQEWSEILNTNSEVLQYLEPIHWTVNEFLEMGDKHEMDIPEILITYRFNGPGKIANGNIQESAQRDSLLNKLKSLENLLEEHGSKLLTGELQAHKSANRNCQTPVRY